MLIILLFFVIITLEKIINSVAIMNFFSFEINATKIPFLKIYYIKVILVIVFLGILMYRIIT